MWTLLLPPVTESHQHTGSHSVEGLDSESKGYTFYSPESKLLDIPRGRINSPHTRMDFRLRS